ncbi:MAG TPA: hypothetical protein VFM28_04290 [Nitrososphaeraceae archaeon]|nr:hypothetical protein [Nitrososphaeraceae archaeon]
MNQFLSKFLPSITRNLGKQKKSNHSLDQSIPEVTCSGYGNNI